MSISESLGRAVLQVLQRHTPSARNALVKVLAELDEAAELDDATEEEECGCELEVRLEVSPHYYSVMDFETRETILPDTISGEVFRELRDVAEAADADLYRALDEEVFTWLADVWEEVRGPSGTRPAFAFRHGGPDEPRYDLNQRKWLSAEEDSSI